MKSVKSVNMESVVHLSTKRSVVQDEEKTLLEMTKNLQKKITIRSIKYVPQQSTTFRFQRIVDMLLIKAYDRNHSRLKTSSNNRN